MKPTTTINTKTDKKSNTPQKAESNILLVCILNFKSLQITPVFLYHLFVKYGAVKKVLIFEKNLVWKAFVEMGSAEEAQKAKSYLDNYLLFNDGSKLNIHYSNLPQLSFPVKSQDAQDFVENPPNMSDEIIEFNQILSPTHITRTGSNKWNRSDSQRGEVISPTNPHMLPRKANTFNENDPSSFIRKNVLDDVQNGNYDQKSAGLRRNISA